MTDWEKIERTLRALGHRSRLDILACIRQGASNPGEMAHKVGRHRSTIEKHLRVLLRANIVEKVPSLTKGGQLTVRYQTRGEVEGLLEAVQEFSENL